MRTTMVIDDDLMREARLRAATEGISVSELLSRALRAALVTTPPIEAPPRFQMVTYGRGLPKVDHAPEDFAGVLEDEDRPH